MQGKFLQILPQVIGIILYFCLNSKIIYLYHLTHINCIENFKTLLNTIQVQVPFKKKHKSTKE